MNDSETALYHAGLGRFVFPCKRDKTPHTPHGFRDASTDLAQLIERGQTNARDG